MTDTQPPDHTAQVAGLSRELEAMGRTVADLGTTIEGLATLPAQLQNMGNVVARLAQQAAQTGGDDAPGAVTWLGFDGDTDDAEAVLGRLVEWVQSIYLRYTDARKSTPSCWMWHEDIVEEMLWLRDAWVQAHSPRARSHDVGDWHDRQRPGVVRRVRTYAGACSIEEHVPTTGRDNRSLPAPVVHFKDAIPAVAHWWATDRNAPGPAPTDQQLWTEQLNTSSGRVR